MWLRSVPLKGGDRHGNYPTGYITGNQTFPIPLGAATRLQMGFYSKLKCSVLLLFKKSVSHVGTMKYSRLGFDWETCGVVFIQSYETLSSPNVSIMQDPKRGFTDQLPDINLFNNSFMGIHPSAFYAPVHVFSNCSPPPPGTDRRSSFANSRCHSNCMTAASSPRSSPLMR